MRKTWLVLLTLLAATLLGGCPVFTRGGGEHGAAGEAAGAHDGHAHDGHAH